jgi:hypothetical protein
MTNDNSSAIVSKVSNYAHVLKNAGVGYGDYIEQITYLLLAPTFGLRAVAQPCGLPVSPSARLLKLADEMTELGFDNPIPDEFKWSELSSKVAAASRRNFHGYPQRRDASATLSLSCLTN